MPSVMMRPFSMKPLSWRIAFAALVTLQILLLSCVSLAAPLAAAPNLVTGTTSAVQEAKPNEPPNSAKQETQPAANSEIQSAKPAELPATDQEKPALPKPQVKGMRGDIVFVREKNEAGNNGYPPATFPHAVHRYQYKCYVCH